MRRVKYLKQCHDLHVSEWIKTELIFIFQPHPQIPSPSNNRTKMSSNNLPTRLPPPTIQSTQCLLLTLPREIRDDIYNYVFTSSALQIRPITPLESAKINNHYKKDNFQHYHHVDPCNLLDPHASIAPRISTILATSIFFTSHQIHEEALQVLYETKTVYLSLYHGCKEGGLLESTRLGEILERARYLRISTYNISFLSAFLPVLSPRSDIKNLEMGFRTVHGLRCISSTKTR